MVMMAHGLKAMAIQFNEPEELNDHSIEIITNLSDVFEKTIQSILLKHHPRTSYCPLVAEAFDMEYHSIQCAKETHASHGLTTLSTERSLQSRDQHQCQRI